MIEEPEIVLPSKRNKRARVLRRNVGSRRIVAVVGPSKMGGDSVWTVYDLDAED